MFFLSIFINQLITAVVLFHCCSFNLFCISLLMLSRINLLILSISFLAWLMSLMVASFLNFSLWSFNITKYFSCRWLAFTQGCFSYWLFFILIADGFSGIYLFACLGYRIIDKLLVFLFSCWMFYHPVWTFVLTINNF